ncbi:Palmitoyltransferase Hip14 [Linum perenne]
MLRLNDRRGRLRLDLFQLVGRSAISCVFVLITQFTLSLVPWFFSASSLLVQFLLSVVVLVLVVGFGRWCRRLSGVSASAPALVVFSTLFVWGVYFVVVRSGIQLAQPKLIQKSFCIPFQGTILPMRIRYCKSCDAYIRGFDHHCPAFGNCIGYKNHVLFMVLLFGFLATETSYVACCFQVFVTVIISNDTRPELV